MVTAILIIVSGIILANNNRFGGKILLDNLAYDVALTLRQAQVYGISVRQFGSGNFSIGYGMHFTIGNPTSYILFADAIEADGIYNGCPSSASCELVENTDIQRGYHIQSLCVTPSGGAEVCNSTTTGYPNRLDLLFKRPEPDAYIRANEQSELLGRARIVLESPRGDEASVIVEATGQIATE